MINNHKCKYQIVNEDGEVIHKVKYQATAIELKKQAKNKGWRIEKIKDEK